MGYDKKKESWERRIIELFSCIIIFLVLFVLMFSNFVAGGDPEGPSEVVIESNQTKTPIPGYFFNISGGYISQMNISVVSQNQRWKAFVGQIFGKFTLDDANGATIYDWSIATITGEVYATRKDTSVTWTNLNCSNLTTMEQENVNLGHTSTEDNITRTFNTTGNHDEFFVAGVNISYGSCYSLNTFINDSAQSTYFDEVVLHEIGTGYLVYATIIENDIDAYNRDPTNERKNDFQMIVPERGEPDFKGATPYYIYVELG